MFPVIVTWPIFIFLLCALMIEMLSLIWHESPVLCEGASMAEWLRRLALKLLAPLLWGSNPMSGSCQLLTEGCWFTPRNNLFLQLWKLTAIYNQTWLRNGVKHQFTSPHPCIVLYSVRFIPIVVRDTLCDLKKNPNLSVKSCKDNLELWNKPHFQYTEIFTWFKTI